MCQTDRLARESALDPSANADRCRISVLLVCYNQARYIDEAIDGILRQVVDAPFEVVVADDASTDGTRGIATSRFAARPDLPVRFLPSLRNLGYVANFRRGFAACRAPLVAPLEGDDAWTDPNKLALQAACMDTHPDCAVSATNLLIVEANGAATPRAPPGTAISLLDAEALVADNLPGNISACMYRRPALQALSDAFWAAPCGDWLLNLCVIGQGRLAFLHQVMSTYRRTDSGIWASLPRPAQLRLLLDILPQYDAVTGHRLGPAFARAADAYRQELAQIEAAA